jgi:hypothetical protein
MSESVLYDALARKRDRTLAVILGVKERECDPYLPDRERAKLRKVILDQVNELCVFAGDLLESLGQGSVFNEIYLEKLDAIYEAVRSNGS